MNKKNLFSFNIMPKIISDEIKKNIYKDYKKNNVNMNDIVEKYKVNKRTVYMICKKLSNDETIQNLKTSSSENDNKWDNKSITNEKLDTINEINWKENLTTPYIDEKNNDKLEKIDDKKELSENNENEKNDNKSENDDTWKNEGENIEEEKNELSNSELINFLKKSDIPIIKDEKIIKNPLTIKRVSFCEDNENNSDILPEKNNFINNIDEKNNKKWNKKQYNKKNILNENDIEIITNNNVDLSNNEKNNLIIKIRKYYIYFEDELKNIIDKRRLNNLFKLDINELNCIYQLIQIEIKSKSNLNFESIADFSLSKIENISKFIGCDITGIKDTLLNDDMFIKNLKILEIENGTIMDFMTPKKIIIYLFFRSCYTQYNMNKNDK